MTDHADLIRRLIDEDDTVAPRHAAADAIKELVAERDNLVSVICEHVAKRKEYYDRAEKAERECVRLGFVVDAQVRRAEKAEADLAAAREALERIKSVARNPTTNERLSACWKIANEAAIAAARAEGGE